MSTLYQLKTRIANDLHRSDLTTQISEAIDRAIDHYSRERWWFLETSTTITTSATSTYSLPSDFESIDTVMLTVSGDRYAIDQIDYRTMDEEDDGSTTGQPDYFAIRNTSIRFYPVPDGTWTCSLSYSKSLDAPSDGGSNAWTTDAEELIRFRAEWDIFANYLRNIEMAQVAKSSESEAFNNLVSGNIKRISTGKLAKSGF